MKEMVSSCTACEWPPHRLRVLKATAAATAAITEKQKADKCATCNMYIIPKGKTEREVQK